MSLLIEIFMLIALAGLIGGFLGWILHGSCKKTDEYIDETREEIKS